MAGSLSSPVTTEYAGNYIYNKVFVEVVIERSLIKIRINGIIEK
ncbi:hypothetical protein TPENAI_61172 [Tenacibaculum litopenaei]